MNRRGETDAIRVIMTIVLVLVVGFLILWGFNTNWKFWSSSTGTYTQSNVGSQVLACKGFCQSGTAGKASYCYTPHKVNFGQDIMYNGETVDSVSLTCSQLSESFRQYGFETCENFC